MRHSRGHVTRKRRLVKKRPVWAANMRQQHRMQIKKQYFGNK